MTTPPDPGQGYGSSPGGEDTQPYGTSSSPPSNATPYGTPTYQPLGTQPYPAQPYPAQPYPAQSYPPPADQHPYGLTAVSYPPQPQQPYGPAGYQGYPPAYGGERISSKSRTVASLLSFFLGGLGIDRFYLGNIGMGVAKLFLGWATLGIWPLIDFIVIVAGSAHDGTGARVVRWE